MRDWFTGEKLWNMEYKQFSIHHIFPQSRFVNNTFIHQLNNLGFSYADLGNPNFILI